MRKDILDEFEKIEKEKFNQLQQMMLAKHYVIKGESDETAKNIAYYNAYLLSNFGIEITNPKELTKEAVREIANYFKLDVPSSFYSNPTDGFFQARFPAAPTFSERVFLQLPYRGRKPCLFLLE